MAESLLIQTDIIETVDSCSDPSNGSALFQRRIKFHPARKPFRGFNAGDSDFKLETLNPCNSSDPRLAGSASSSAPGGSKNDGSEFSDYVLDPELCFGMTFRSIGAGLRNLGNTCFLNSVLQCLTYTEPLAAYLQSGRHKNSCQIAGFCALCAIQNHVSRALQSSGRILSPEALVVNLRCISRNFRNARQEDAHEYMVNLLESMHKCCLPSGVPSESPSAYEKSLVHKIFGGRLRSQVKCEQCSNCSNKFDPFIDLSLEIFNADSLHKALANFTAAEWLDGGEKQYQCQRCKQKVRALKQLTIHKAPYVLAVHLKRFHAYDPGQKIKKKVQFGCALDLKPFVSGSYEGDLKYSLYGVLVHSGHSTHSGHYYCYVRTSNSMWYTLDDNWVSHVNEQEVLNQQAYMLFYVRDIKGLALRKPVDIARKENMKMNVNASGVRASSTVNHGLKEPVRNGPEETRFSGAFSSTAEAPKDASNVDSSKVSLLKDVSVQQRNSLILEESLMQGIEPVSEPSSQIQSQKDSPARVSVVNSVPECLLSLDHSGKDHCHPHNLKISVARAGEDISRCIENGISKEDKDSLSTASTVHEPIISAAKHVTSETSQKSNFVTVNVVTPEDSGMNTSNCTDPITSLMQQSNQNSQIGGSATVSVRKKADGILDEIAVGNQGLVLDESVNKFSDIDGSKNKRFKKLKKKLLKYQVSSMHLGSNFFFMASLGLQKKKNRRSKCRAKRMKNLNKEKLDKHISSDVMPSTHGLSGVVPLESSCFECWATKLVYKMDANHMTPLNSNSELQVENVANGEFRKRINQNSAVLATADQVEKIYRRSSLVNQCEARYNGSLQEGKRDQMHNGLRSIITGDLEETVVASWDDIELPPSQSVESKNDKTVGIGYIADEWDEEYDRSKRKKLKRYRHSFGGPNPFQKIATKKSQFKRAKVDHSNSGSLPFRI